MKRRLALGALGACVALALTGVGPASAAFPPTVTVDGPGENATWNGGSVSDFHVVGHADTDNGATVTKVTVNVDPTDAGTGHYQQQAAWPQSDNNPHRSFDIQIFPDLNGKYRVSTVAWGITCFLTCSAEQAGPPVVRNITLAVPPKAPTGTKSSQTDGKVTIEWNANNTEKDLLGYIVERANPNADYKCLVTKAVADGTPPATYKVTDEIKDTPDGDVRWRVKAVRASNTNSEMPTCTKAGTGIASAPSVSTKITWKNPPPPTTTTTTKGGGGSATTTTTRPKTGTPAPGSTGTGSAARRPNLSALGSLGVPNNLAAPPRLRTGLNEPDPGFNELLPFQAGEESEEIGGSALPQTEAEEAESDNGATTLLFVAASLLAGVLAAHVLWLKAEVDRMPLEALTPEELPPA